MIRKLFLLVFAGALLAGGVFVYLLMQPPAPKSTTPEPGAPAVEKAPSPAPASAEPERVEPATKPGKKNAPKPKQADAPVEAEKAADAAPTTGTLRITADVPEASVFIDRKYVGTAPVTASDLAPGAHRLNVSAKGFDAVTEDIDVAVGTREIAVKLKEVRLNASLVVKHKHGMGSCEGTLKATPQGITFETTNKDDAFTVTLADIETFEVDYAAKNLKIKVKKGRTYNFTDPDGNADKLFVFHRDVDKARVALLRER